MPRIECARAAEKFRFWILRGPSRRQLRLTIPSAYRLEREDLPVILPGAWISRWDNSREDYDKELAAIELMAFLEHLDYMQEARLIESPVRRNEMSRPLDMIVLRILPAGHERLVQSRAAAADRRLGARAKRALHYLGKGSVVFVAGIIAGAVGKFAIDRLYELLQRWSK